MTKLKKSNCEELKIFFNCDTVVTVVTVGIVKTVGTVKTVVTVLKFFSIFFGISFSLKLWQNSKHKCWQLKNSICEKTQKFKLWQNSRTKMGTKFKNSNCDKAQKLQLWPNSKTQIVAINFLKKCDKTKKKTQIVTVVLVTVLTVVIVTSFSKNNLTPQQPRCSWGSFSWFSRCFPNMLKIRVMC